MKENTLLPWYETLINSKAKLALFCIAVILLSPLVLLYGALYPLFERYQS